MVKVTALAGAQARATVKDVRRVNQTTLLRELFFGGPTSRQALSAATGLSSGTVTTVVGGLLEDGLVVEAGLEESDGGRPRTLLEIARDRAVALGVDVGETRVRIEAFDLGTHKLGGRDIVPTGGRRSPDRLADEVAGAIHELLPELGIDPGSVAGLGVGVAGIVDATRGLVHSVTTGWDGVPFAALLRSRLRLPVLVDNGAKTMGQAEMWFGAGRDARHAIVALLGTGVGAAVFTDGALYRGASSSAGEWGHMTVVAGGDRCRCGSTGCLEAYVGAGAIARRWDDAIGQAREDQEQAVAAVARAIGSDPRADALADDLAGYLGAGLGSLINLFNPERIVIAGWVAASLGPSLLPRIRERTAAHALPRPYEQVAIVLGMLGTDAVALGAATLVIEGILTGELTLPRGWRPGRALSG